MNDFERALSSLVGEATEIQERESKLKVDQQIFMNKWSGFMKEAGLPENFTLPQLAMLSVRKARELILP